MRMNKDLQFQLSVFSVWLQVSQTRKEMHETAIKMGVKDLTSETQGAFNPVLEEDKLGVIFINLEDLKNTPGIIMHEAGHCVFELLYKSGFKKIPVKANRNSIQEESFLHTQNRIVDIIIQFISDEYDL